MAKFGHNGANPKIVLFRGGVGVLPSGGAVQDTGSVALPTTCLPGSVWDGSGYAKADFTIRGDTDILKEEYQAVALAAYLKAVSTDMRNEQWALYAPTAAKSATASKATRKWHYCTKAIIDGILGGTIGATWTLAVKRTALDALIGYLGLSATWYGVVLGYLAAVATATTTNSWANMSLAAGAVMYHDGINAAGAVRTLDGAFNSVGWPFPAGYDPEAQ